MKKNDQKKKTPTEGYASDRLLLALNFERTKTPRESFLAACDQRCQQNSHLSTDSNLAMPCLWLTPNYYQVCLGWNARPYTHDSACSASLDMSPGVFAYDCRLAHSTPSHTPSGAPLNVAGGSFL